MKILGFIPSRYGSTRLSAKPLALINGKPMIEHVYLNSKKSRKIDDLIVLTDDERIAKVVEDFGGKYCMTSKDCNSGTERIISVLDKFDFDIAINIQGDEPLVNGEDLDLLCESFSDNVEISTLITNTREDIANPNIVKVVFDNWKNAIYFSRSIIPFDRDGNSRISYYKHIGIYAYRKNVLEKFSTLKSSLDDIEKLEQLKFLENGYKIRTVFTENNYVSVDVQEDLDLLNSLK